jgi:16S rRNA (cytidine1402-2'-O)-methyltransferase
MDRKKIKGTLYLIPSLLGECPADRVIPGFNREIIRSLNYYIVEEVRTARRFIRKVCPELDIDPIQFMVFNEHSGVDDLSFFMKPLLEGIDVGLLSEAGTPCVADPGSEIVALAREKEIKVVPLTGPSSILLSLMASGFNGQNFAFQGYLPIEKSARAKKLRELERNAQVNDQTQIFIETPYRNLQLFQAILESCNDATRVCVACDLTAESEMILVRTVKEWKGKMPDINKKPVVFLLYK